MWGGVSSDKRMYTIRIYTTRATTTLANYETGQWTIVVIRIQL